jgi:hypothetical protein
MGLPKEHPNARYGVDCEREVLEQAFVDAESARDSTASSKVHRLRCHELSVRHPAKLVDSIRIELNRADS